MAKMSITQCGDLYTLIHEQLIGQRMENFQLKNKLIVVLLIADKN